MNTAFCVAAFLWHFSSFPVRKKSSLHLLSFEFSSPNVREDYLGAHMQEELAPATGAQPEADSTKEIMPSMEEMLKTAELVAAEHHDAWLRAKAETENMRRRAQTDVDNARKFAVENFASEMLAVKDSLEAALSVESPSVENMKNGVDLTLKQLISAFGKFSLAEINPLGEKFDPHQHQAIAMIESEQPANTVVTVLQKGYRLHERTIRPAMVMVAKGRD
jgi:molecular chaperone GrpE